MLTLYSLYTAVVCDVWISRVGKFINWLEINGFPHAKPPIHKTDCPLNALANKRKTFGVTLSNDSIHQHKYMLALFWKMLTCNRVWEMAWVESFIWVLYAPLPVSVIPPDFLITIVSFSTGYCCSSNIGFVSCHKPSYIYVQVIVMI